MAAIFTPGLTVSERQIVLKDRRLPLEGEVAVAVGDTVSADDIVARTELPGKAYPVNVANQLGVDPGRLKNYLKKTVREHCSGQRHHREHLGRYWTSDLPGPSHPRRNRRLHQRPGGRGDRRRGLRHSELSGVGPRDLRARARSQRRARRRRRHRRRRTDRRPTWPACRSSSSRCCGPAWRG